MLHEIRTRDGACETYWLETSGSRGRVVPRAYAIAILALARRHGFRRGTAKGRARWNPYKVRWIEFRTYRDGELREIAIRPYTGNAW